MNFYLRIRLLFLFVGTLLLSGCTQNKDQLNKIVRRTLKGDNNVDEHEWKQISEFLVKNKGEYPDFLNGDEVNVVFLRQHIQEVSSSLKERFKGINQLYIYTPSKEVFETDINVFIENSGSMDGYVKGITEFEAALSDLLVQFQYIYDKKNLNVNFINNKVYLSKVREVNEFIKSLEPNKKPYNVGDRRASELNEMFKTVLAKVNKNSISVLVSDCIYSLGRDRDTESALNFQKSLTKGEFLQKSKEIDISTIVLQMDSKFSGNYYTKENRREYLNKKRRPYFFWIIGTPQQLSKLQERIELKELEGFQNSFTLQPSSQQQPPFYSILRNFSTVGDFVPANRRQQIIKEIRDVDFHNGEFQFAIAVDFSSIKIGNDYLTDKTNYVLNNFEIVEIKRVPLSELKKSDKDICKRNNATHIIVLRTDNEAAIQDVTIKLPSKIPQWVYNANTINDKNIALQLDKTFGIKYLIEGVAESYNMTSGENNYTSITIKIKK